MRTLLVFGLVSLIWFAAGVAMVAAPGWWSGQLQRSMTDPARRFLVMQGMALAGVLLVLGASAEQRSWFWIVVGSFVTAKGLVLLGLPDSRRERLLSWWNARPLWLQRLAGVAAVALATLLALDAIRMSR